MKLLRKIITTFFIILLLFVGLSFTMNNSIQQYAAAPCTSYLQPNQCTVGPDQGINQGVNYIVDKCDNGGGGFNYYCFDPTKNQYYTQPDTCTVGPYQYNQPGHLFLVKKVAPNTFYCVTDCTAYPGFPGCPATANSPTPPQGYTFCSNENSTCTLKGTEDVAYGANGKFNYFTAKTGPVQCDNATLGPDPIPKTAKACFVKPSGTTKKYLCSNNACVEDDTNGTFTDSACGGKCTAPQTNLTLVLGLPGIGYDGGTPKHTTRNVTVELYDPTVTNPGGPGTKALASAPGVVTYDDKGDNNDGYFTSLTPISFPNLPTNSYQILIKMPQYLYKLAINASNTNAPTVFTLTQGTTTVLSPLVLVPGNVVTTGGHTNNISILDWSAIRSCYGANQNTGACPSPIRPPSASDLNLADLNDDGVVDVVDLNLWLRSWKLLVSNNAPGCDTGSCQGD